VEPDFEFVCTECHKICDVFDRTEIDHEPYGDQIVERISIYVLSECCEADVEELEIGPVIH
jgi:hypothetical protein